MQSHSRNLRHHFVEAQDSCAPCPQDHRFSWSLMALFFVFSVAGMIPGCQSSPAKRYPLKAEVISVDAPRKLIVVKHGEIPGLMPAMTMPYAVRDSREIEQLRTGDKITADLVVADEKGHLEKIVLVEKASGTPFAPAPTK